METVSKVVNAATAALWGDGTTAQQQSIPHGEEPIAGVQGSGKPNDPYDAGNREEQPEAPISEGNTAPQEPRIDGAKTDPLREDLVTDIKPDNDENIPQQTPVAPIPAPPTLTSPEVSPVPIEGGASSSSQAAPQAEKSSGAALATPTKTEQRATEPSASSSSQAAPQAENSSGAALATPTKTEQRATEPSAGESSQASSHATEHREVSKEALQGPQGPAPIPAEEFEKEEAEMKTAKKRESKPQSKEKEKEKGNEKHSPLHKMKEKLSKVAHPRHGSNKA